jgi:hypothetical protein
MMLLDFFERIHVIFIQKRLQKQRHEHHHQQKHFQAMWLVEVVHCSIGDLSLFIVLGINGNE